MTGPHASTRTLTYGVPLEQAKAAVILLHGRGSSPEDILSLVPYIDHGDTAYLAPAAAGSTWYPQPFLAPQQANQPWLSSALARVKGLLDQLTGGYLSTSRIALMGFSQGGCLVTEYAARNPARYGSIIAFSGGVIGHESDLKDYTGTLAGTPVLMGCSDIDPFIPLARVRRTEDILREMGADVDVRIYPGMGHLVNADELAAARDLVGKLVLE